MASAGIPALQPVNAALAVVAAAMADIAPPPMMRMNWRRGKGLPSCRFVWVLMVNLLVCLQQL
jgi:hypothetical protein